MDSRKRTRVAAEVVLVEAEVLVEVVEVHEVDVVVDVEEVDHEAEAVDVKKPFLISTLSTITEF